MAAEQNKVGSLKIKLDIPFLSAPQVSKSTQASKASQLSEVPQPNASKTTQAHQVIKAFQ